MTASHPGRDNDWESRRLAALDSYQVLDTPTEKQFDEVARLASEICGTPIAVVNFIGADRQFFKAEVGLGVRETPYASSFCAKAILEQDFMLVPDATESPAFRDNPLVVGEPHLRFYAGALLKNPDGLPIGTVCVLGYEPRTLNELQQRTLRVLADQVMTQLELRRVVREQDQKLRAERRLNSRHSAILARLNLNSEASPLEDARFAAAHGAGRIGVFEVDVSSGETTVSAEFCRIFGVPIEPVYPARVFEDLVLAEDRSMISDNESRISETAELDVDYRIRRHSDGSVRWITRRARFIVGSSQEPKMVGVVMDVTDNRLKDMRILSLLSLGDQLRVVETSMSAVRIAAEILAEGLGVIRAGYSSIDLTTDAFEVEYNWTNDSAVSLEGRHSLNAFKATLDRLSEGATVAVPNVAGAFWLSEDAKGYASIGVRSFVKVPIVDNGMLIGVIFAHDNQPRYWTEDELGFAWGVADRTHATLAKLKAEDQQRILNEELNHRLKNSLALVQAIAGQTLKDVEPKDAVKAFTLRLKSLSAAHDVLLRQSWSAAELHEIVDSATAPHADRSRFNISGPSIKLGSKAALSLSLIIHELGTNAVKYGALSSSDGKVDITWRIDSLATGAELELVWSERDGPLVVEPKRKGFGSRLIKLGLAGTGDVTKSYSSTGFVAVFRANLNLIQEVG